MIVINNFNDSAIKRRHVHVTFMLLALAVMSYYYYGIRAVIVTALSVFASVLVEYICCLATNKKYDWSDFSPIASGLILAMLMPASVPYRIVIFSSAFMASVCKHAFGGSGNVIFSPVAVSYIFSALAWPSFVLRYPTPQFFGSLPLETEISGALGRSFTYLVDNSLSSANYLDILLGRLSGPMGTYALAVIIIAAVSLLLLKDIPVSAFASALAVNCALNVIFPLTYTGFEAVFYSILTGSFTFVLTFMLCDPELAPKQTLARVIYGITFSVITFVLRRLCGLENSAVYAVVIAQIFVADLDRFSAYISNISFSLNNKTFGKVRKFIIFLKFWKAEKKKEVNGDEQ